MQISPRLLNAWSDLQRLKNVFILKKVKRSTMQTPQNNTERVSLSCTQQNVLWGGKQTDIYIQILNKSPQDLLLNIPYGNMLDEYLLDDPSERVNDIPSIL